MDIAGFGGQTDGLSGSLYQLGQIEFGGLDAKLPSSKNPLRTTAVLALNSTLRRFIAQSAYCIGSTFFR